MNQKEIIEAITALDADVKTEGLRNKELGLILDGLKSKENIEKLEKEIAELSTALTEVESRPAAKGQAFEVPVGKHEGKTVLMTAPKVRVDGAIYTAAEIKARPDLVEKLIKDKAGYLKIKSGK